MSITTATIPHKALAAAERWPNDLAISDGQRQLTFAELADAMHRCAAALVAAGVETKDRIALWAENRLEWIVACLGIQAAGAVLIPLNTRFKAAEAHYILERSGASLAIVSTNFLGTDYASQIDLQELPSLKRVIRLDDDGHDGWDAFLAEAEQPQLQEVEKRLEQLSPNDICDILFTSGTTGAPKGVLSTHQQTVATAALWAKATTLTRLDRFLILWPFFHCAGYKAGWLSCLCVGATTLPEKVLDVPTLLQRVASESVTFLPGPPTLFQTLLTTPDLEHDALASVRVSVTGASSVAPSLIDQMRDTLRIPIVLTGYGLTEVCGTATMTTPNDPAEVVTSSCGKAIEGIEVVVLDDSGNILPAGEVGEVCIRGNGVMQGYLDDPDATRETIDANGWLHTGDIGVLNAQGYLSITDRKKEMFITGGFNCYPAEIEKVLLGHPQIQSVAVIGVADTRLGEVGKAFIVPAPRQTIDEQGISSWCKERMANYKVPRYIEVTKELPVNSTGKVQKFKLNSQPG